MNTERYIRQTVLKDFGPEAQQKLAEAKVLVVGAGGLGIPVLTYLNAMGIGMLGIVDGDTVSLSNLHRQVLYNEEEVGQSKVDVVIKKLEAQNSNTQFVAYRTFLALHNALDIIKDYDLVIDASDNFPTRYLINDVCVMLKKPFVYGALHGFEGQVTVFNHEGGPTYRCLFPNMPLAEEIPNCNEHGVLGVIPGIIGNLQALESVKVITEIGKVLSGKLLLFNGLEHSFQKIKFKLNQTNLGITELQESYELECGVKTNSIDVNELERRLLVENDQVIDVRTSEEFNEFHLNNTINLPLSDIGDWKHRINFDLPVYLVCQSGIRSHQALLALKEYYPNANLFNVEGGINNLRSYAAKY